MTREGRLDLPRPPHCLRCGADCGFTKDGHYFRDFVFLDAVAEHIGVPRYECKKTARATFTVLPAFQEPGAHYTVEVRGEVLEEVFVQGSSKRAAWRTLRRRAGCHSLARSTVTRWCRSFSRHAGRLASILRAPLAQKLPEADLPATSDPASVIRLARAASRLHRRPRWRFWEAVHETLWTAARSSLLALGRSRTRCDRRPHVWVLRFGLANRLRSPPIEGDIG